MATPMDTNCDFNRFVEELAMSTEQSLEKASRPQLVKLDRAFKLAERWVNDMSKSSYYEAAEVELEARPQRLGVGATVSRQFSTVAPSNDPVERKLRAKLEAKKKKVARNENYAPSVKNGSIDEDSTDDELESRTKVFMKKRTVDLTPTQLEIKKKLISHTRQ